MISTSSPSISSLHYFGEDVDNYRNGKVASNSGSFRYGEDTQNLGGFILLS